MILAALTALMMAAVGTTSASARVATDTSNKSVSKPCIDQNTGEEQGTFTWAGPTASWPPNHKDKTATITLTDVDDEPATDEVTLGVIGTHDEMTTEDNVTTEDTGTGNTDPVTDSTGGADAGTGSATVPVRWRAERSGHGDGRTYTFTASGTTDGTPTLDGSLPSVGTGMCEDVTFTVEVPHDQGNGAGKPAAKRSAKLHIRRAAR
jgi:hypothetical protein